MEKPRIEPADQPEREAILNDLHTSLLVEAAAGTGKTTSMVGRMVNLLAEGCCSIETVAAVTFTRKAAAELRSRFQVELEKACRSRGPRQRGRLADALAGVDRCFIGTIHSFCGRLLRERPVEAGVDVAFREIDDTEDSVMRQEAWDRYLVQLHVEDNPVLEELDRLGVEIGSLADAFAKFAQYPDVEEWPASKVDLPDLTPVRNELESLVRHMEALSLDLPENAGNDTLIPKYRVIPLMWRHAREDHLPDLMDILAEFKSLKVVQKNWPGGKAQALAEQERCDRFKREFAEPLLQRWREKCYEPIMRVLKPAAEMYDQLRRRAGVLNYQDLLMAAAGLLRDKPRVREYFRARFTHLLVDEFQDTDPIQAEVMLYLTAGRSAEQDWRQCRPVKGSLFVVGDPKQSIYRFRRADIVTYNHVKHIIQESGGRVVTLSVNFRTTRPLVELVNRTFEPEFPVGSSEYSPQYVPLVPVIEDRGGADLGGVRGIAVPADFKNNADVNEFEADFIARMIHHAISAGLTVPRSDREIAAGIAPVAGPGDFLIITPKKRNLGLYARKLEGQGIPHQVTGGSALNQVNELSLLRSCLAAVLNPDDPIALVAVLRSELFGLSDAALYRFRKNRGVFSYLSAVPPTLEQDSAELFLDAFQRLRRYSLWLKNLPAVVALEKMAGHLGLLAAAALAAGGNVQAGSLAKALEILRGLQPAPWTADQVLTRLSQLVKRDENFDGMSAAPETSAMVRVMNLHKVKGLEAPVVFLADPTGENDFPPDLHVDRSGDKVRGFMKVSASGVRVGKALALPQQWASYEVIENHFQEAERLRLLYVAATRSGAALIITSREKGQKKNWWGFFCDKVPSSAAIPDPGTHKLEAGERADLEEGEVSKALAAIQDRLAHAEVPTYHVAAAKVVSLSETPSLGSGGEHGTEWGTLIHLLLQTAMLDSAADLSALAQAEIDELGMEPSRTGEAVALVRSVMDSEIWKRAAGADEVLVEVPFQALGVLDKSGDGDTRTLLRGVIDLAFRETGGWVIVDYKTDRRPAGATEELVEHYRNQVLTYAQAWERISGRPVQEAGLYFTHLNEYRRIV